jgi:hypothetical protein
MNNSMSKLALFKESTKLQTFLLMIQTACLARTGSML